MTEAGRLKVRAAPLAFPIAKTGRFRPLGAAFFRDDLGFGRGGRCGFGRFGLQRGGGGR